MQRLKLCFITFFTWGGRDGAGDIKRDGLIQRETVKNTVSTVVGMRLCSFSVAVFVSSLSSAALRRRART